jgi:hypothetical protein
MWQFANYPPVRGEANIKTMVSGSKALQDEIMAACNAFHEAERPQCDADGTVIDVEVAVTSEDVTVDL